MATLGSPGVQVIVQDESFYTPAAPGTVPLIFIASRQDKSNAAASGTAQGTTASQQGNVFVITSQRDLTDTFGNPIFETDASENVIQGSEISEYGLQAAYSALGVSSRALIVRADVDLGDLSSSATAPTGTPINGKYWVDTTNTLFGVNEWDKPTQKFTVKTVKILDDITSAGKVNGSMVPLSNFGNQGDYAMVVTSDNENTLYYKRGNNAWTAVVSGFDGGKQLIIGPHTSYPDFTSTGSDADTGSVWVKTTTPGFGANWVIKLYNGSTKAWSTVSAPMYDTPQIALRTLDATGGGRNIPVGTLFVEPNYENGTGVDYTANFKVWRRKNTGATSISITANTPIINAPLAFEIRETLASTGQWSPTYTVNIPNSTIDSLPSLFPAAVSTVGLTHISCTYDPVTKRLTISHDAGGDFQLTDDANSPLSLVGFNTITTANLYGAPSYDQFQYLASNWSPLNYEATSSAPVTAPADGTL